MEPYAWRRIYTFCIRQPTSQHPVGSSLVIPKSPQVSICAWLLTLKWLFATFWFGGKSVKYYSEADRSHRQNELNPFTGYQHTKQTPFPSLQQPTQLSSQPVKSATQFSFLGHKSLYRTFNDYFWSSLIYSSLKSSKNHQHHRTQ